MRANCKMENVVFSIPFFWFDSLLYLRKEGHKVSKDLRWIFSVQSTTTLCLAVEKLSQLLHRSWVGRARQHRIVLSLSAQAVELADVASTVNSIHANPVHSKSFYEQYSNWKRFFFFFEIAGKYKPLVFRWTWHSFCSCRKMRLQIQRQSLTQDHSTRRWQVECWILPAEELNRCKNETEFMIWISF